MATQVDGSETPHDRYKSTECSICGNRTYLFGQRTYVDGQSVNWIHDGTFELIGEESVSVSFRFCFSSLIQLRSATVSEVLVLKKT